jgi:hypothetical protein
MLLDISKGVDRLHEQVIDFSLSKKKSHVSFKQNGYLCSQASKIGEEAKVQIRLLDDLDGNVELATTALQVNILY